MTIPGELLIDVHGTLEGPELLRNSEIDGQGQPWFSWVAKPELGVIKPGDGAIKVDLHDPPNWWLAGLGQQVAGLQPGGRYRLAIRASNTGNAGMVYLQLATGAQDTPVRFLVNSRPLDTAKLPIGDETALHTLEFVIPRDAKLQEATKVILQAGGLRNATIDSISLREIVARRPRNPPALPLSKPAATETDGADAMRSFLLAITLWATATRRGAGHAAKPATRPHPATRPQSATLPHSATRPSTQPATRPAEEPLVYVTPKGGKYHRQGCRYVRDASSPMPLADARAAGYAACRVCKPDRIAPSPAP